MNIQNFSFEQKMELAKEAQNATLLIRLLKDPDIRIGIEIAKRRNVWPFVIEEAAKSTSEAIRAEALKNPNLQKK